MVLIKLEKNLLCQDNTGSVHRCRDNIINSLEVKIGVLLHVDNELDKVAGHVTVYHWHNKPHEVWVFLYDKDGEHEGEITDKKTGKKLIKIQKSNRIKKFIGTKPTKQELEDSIF